MRRSLRQSVMCLVVATSVAAAGCRPTHGLSRLDAPPGPNIPNARASGPDGSGRSQIRIDPDRSDGLLSIRLGESKGAATAGVVTPLSGAETQALIKRLEPLPDLARTNAAAPPLRPLSVAPPPPGGIQPIAFVVPSGKSVADTRAAPAPRREEPTGSLAPPQIAPEGDASVVSEIRIRFDEPMVPVAAVGIAASPPARIAPAVDGTWRWIDSHLLTFTTTAARFPGASRFAVTVPAGARSLGGATLAADARATFATRAPEIVGHFPVVNLRPDSPMVVELDQDVDAARLVPFLRIENKHGRRLAWQPIALADAQRLWAQNPAIKFNAAEAATVLGRHHVILAPATAWPSGAELRAVLAKGAPSREGPIVRDRDTSTTFTVAPRFTVRGVSCRDAEKPRKPRMTGAICPARGYVSVAFSNAIAEKSYRSSMVQIAAPRNTELSDQPLHGDTVWLFAPAAVGQTCEVRVEAGLVDAYGQTLVGETRPSFTTGPERFEPDLDARTGLHVLDPRFQIPQWVVRAQAVLSVRVRLFQVAPEDFFAFEDFEAGRRATPPGKLVASRSYAVGRRHGADIRVDLRPALPASGTGHVVAVATAEPSGVHHDRPDESRRAAWIQVTKLALSARLDGEKVSAWIHDIRPAKLLAPVAGVTTSLLIEGRPGASASAASDPQGHVGFELPPAEREKKHRPRERAVTALLIARSGVDSTFVAAGSHEKTIRQERALWYVTDDRFIYKPGEKVYVKGWIRWTTNGVNPDLALPASGDPVSYSLKDARGNELGSGTAKLSAQGGFDLEVTLPANANLGYASFVLTSKDEHHTHPISIQEFRTPAFAVSLNDDVTHAGAAPLVVGESIEMNASARYYAGGGLGGAGIQWEATLRPAAFAPPGWDLFEFKPVRPRSWTYYGSDGQVGAVHVQQDGTLSGESTAGAAFGIAALPANRPSVLEVDATVTDVDRMSIRARSRAIVVHPSTVYVGLRVRPGHDDVLEAVVTDIDGGAVAGVPIQIGIQGVLGSERYRDDAKVIDTQACHLTSARAPVACSFKRRDRKTAYTATAAVADARGRSNAAQLQVPWYAMPETPEHLAVVPDKPLYRVGDVAKLDILSTVLPATAIVTFARAGVVAQKRVELAGPSTTVELPIEPGFVKNVWVVIDRYGKRRTLEKGSTEPLPEHTSVQINLPVDVESARLEMRTWPRQALIEPGDDATFDVEVKHGGRPVAGAEVALIVVDEAVLALAARSHADPLGLFYDRVGQGTTHVSTIDILPDQGEALAGAPGLRRYPILAGSAISSSYGLGGLGLLGRGGGSGGGSASVVTSRKDFRANAVFSPRLATDANGRVALTVKMPDSLTRYRIIALATAKTRNFGKAESAIVTQRRLNARTIAPRFLTQGDTFSLPVVVQNLDARPRTVDVAVRAANLVGRGPAGKRVVIPAGQRAELRFEFTTLARGRAVVQTIVTSGDYADASNVDLPVYEPATTESFATYGTVDDAPRFEQLVVPTDIFRDVGGVEVQLSSTQLQSLTDAYWYLYAYPYECAEQRSSRMLATGAIYDILDLYETPGRPTRVEIDAQRDKDARLLARDQGRDGGWGYFNGMKSDPFVTMQVLQALAAQKIGGDTAAKATRFVAAEARSLLAALEKAAAAPPARQPDRAQLHYVVSLAATALATLAAVGEDVRPRAARLHALATTLAAYPVDAKARLLALVAKQDRYQAMRAKLLGDILSAVHETASSAIVAASYQETERLLLVSNSKTSALALDALIRERPDHAVISKLARGVLDGRRHGRWMSTQENLVALQAIRRYFDAFEKVTPNYTGKLWLGQAAYAEQSFVGRSNVRGSASLGWSALAPGSAHDLALVKSGPGRMYYRVGITYAPRKTDLEALDAGFIVRRSYTPVDDPADVTRLADGRVKIRLGAKVLVTLEAVNTTHRYQVALVDPLPAGFEAVNSALATAERTATAVGDTHWDFRNLRDNRSEAFATHLGEGRHQFSYTVRATTPGTFIAAPAKAEEMYSPETFGRSSGQAVLIE